MGIVSDINSRLNRVSLVGPLKQSTANSLRKILFYAFRSQVKSRYLQILGMRRTGNHAIIAWIKDGLQGSVFFCNDLSLNQQPENASIKEVKLGLGELSMIASYEDIDPSRISFTCDKSKFGCARAEYHVLILRDPFNLFASRYAWARPEGERFRTELVYREMVINTWKEHARLFLKWRTEKAANGTQSLVPISYNQWLTSEVYRKEISRILKIDPTESTMGKVQNFGGGSTFEGTENVRDRKRYLERFLSLSAEPDFVNIFRDPELLELSDEIFGPIPGSEKLLKKG